ncbi:hypothetical protein HA402_009887 [Bradysia odoriphaga]|nr:hypothetical protein HA402_009887 [Bradysia odoriphaga]
MNAELKEDIARSLNIIIDDYNKKGILDVDLATNFIRKLVDLSVDDEYINNIGKIFANIYNGNVQPSAGSLRVLSSVPVKSVKTSLFDGIQSVLSTAIDGLWNNSTTTTTHSVTSIFRFEIQENGTKSLVWDFNWTKTETPI